MRVTDRLVYERSSRDIANARTAAERARQVVSSGRRVTHPGDDPATAGAIAAFGISSERAEALSRSSMLASEELAVGDAALERVGNAVARARELAVQLANDTYTADQRGAGAIEIRALVADAVAALNARYDNRYVMGGFKDDAPPFAPSGAYVGDAGARQVEIAPGVLQATSVRADVAIQGAGGGVDVLGTLASLATALGANDVTAVRSSLDDLDRSTTQISTARAQVGVSMSTLDAAAEAGKLASEDERSALARLSETDVADGALRLAQAQHALEASMAAAAQSFKLSLLDHLR